MKISDALTLGGACLLLFVASDILGLIFPMLSKAFTFWAGMIYFWFSSKALSSSRSQL